MIQKILCTLSTQANGRFYDMVKGRVINIYKMLNVNIFNMQETLFENIITILPKTHQNKTKMPGKNRVSGLFIKGVKLYHLYKSI